MAHAAACDRVVLTHDLEFGAILAAMGGTRPSVVKLRADDVSPDAIGAQIGASIRQLEAELGAGALVTVEPTRSRMRVLPLRVVAVCRLRSPDRMGDARRWRCPSRQLGCGLSQDNPHACKNVKP